VILAVKTRNERNLSVKRRMRSGVRDRSRGVPNAQRERRPPKTWGVAGRWMKGLNSPLTVEYTQRRGDRGVKDFMGNPRLRL